MSEYCREQHPLLCEEASEEELYSPRYYRRVRSIGYRSRARNNLKGAAAIFTRWPDHWSSFLTYWWIAIGMISLTTFIIYNGLFAFSMLPSANMKPASSLIVNEVERTSSKSALLPDVYMHVFVSQNENIDLNRYLPYIEILTNTFLEFKYHFIIMVNDTNLGWRSAEENNELALNMLWTNDKSNFEKVSRSNINIEHITLSAFMDNSPLRKFWRTLPYQLIEFLARTISIWDKGGIAFNPDILTPGYQHTLYIDKLQKLLNKYAKTNKMIDSSKLSNKVYKSGKKHRKLNNIRDIIDALEYEDISANAFSQQSLSEAENRDIKFIRHERQVSAAKENVAKYVSLNGVNSKNNIGITKSELHIPISTEIIHSTEENLNSTKMSLLPLFLEFLFQNKADTKTKPTDNTFTNRSRRNPIVVPNSEDNNSLSKNSLPQTYKESKTIYKPVIISAAGIYNKSELKNTINTSSSTEIDDSTEANRLTIDLKGNIIATDTACHAFLGTIYSNVIHHSEEETITDFIIAELTIFCKGLLSSCMGIDLILL